MRYELFYPRVAWLLALRETYRPRVPKESWSEWYGVYRTDIAALQDATKRGSDRYWLSVQRLFNGL